MEISINPIGTVIKYNGIRLKVVPRVDRCRGCYFHFQKSCHPQTVGACGKPFRQDEVIFRKYDLAKKENLHSKNSQY